MPTRRIPFVLVVLATGIPMFMATLDNLVITNALPVIHAELGASVEELQWFINAYTLVFASLILLTVGLGDRLGRRTIFIAGIAIFTLASVFAALSTDPTQLIIARAIQGIGGAGIMPLSLSLLSGAVESRRRPLAIGIWGGLAGLGVAVGPLRRRRDRRGPELAVDLLDQRARRHPGDPVRALGAAQRVRRAGAARHPRRRPGRARRAGHRVRHRPRQRRGLGLVRGARVAGRRRRAARRRSCGWESRTASPLLPLRLFRDRSFSIANVVGFGFSFGMFGAVFILIQFLQVVQGASPLEAAIQTTPWTLAPMIIAPIAGIIMPRVGTRLLIVTGLTLQAAGLFWLAATMSADVPYTTMLPAFIAAGIGMSLVFAPSSTAVLANLTPHDTAKGSGTNSTVREIGVALGIAVLTAVFTGAGRRADPDRLRRRGDPRRRGRRRGAARPRRSSSLFLPAGRGRPAETGSIEVPERELVDA